MYPTIHHSVSDCRLKEHDEAGRVPGKLEKCRSTWTHRAVFYHLRVSQKGKEAQERLGTSTTDALRPKTVICSKLLHFFYFFTRAAIDHAIPCLRKKT